MTQEISTSTEDGYYLAYCSRVLNRAKFNIGDSVRLTREGIREIGFRFENQKYLYSVGKVAEVKVHTFVRGERKYPHEPFYLVEFGRHGGKFELDIWERYLKSTLSISCVLSLPRAILHKPGAS
jgi:hypothetical protein